MGDPGHGRVVIVDVHITARARQAWTTAGPARRRSGAVRRCGVITQVRSTNRSPRAVSGPECWDPAIGCDPT